MEGCSNLWSCFGSLGIMRPQMSRLPKISSRPAIYESTMESGPHGLCPAPLLRASHFAISCVSLPSLTEG